MTTSAREALSRIADLGSCARARTPAYKLFQEAIDIAVADVDDWLPIETAPRDRTLIDVAREGIRWTDCHFSTRMKVFVQVHGYRCSSLNDVRPGKWDIHRSPGAPSIES